MQAELTGLGGVGFPDLACLRDARQILISSPAMLAIAVGNFPFATVRQQASAKGMKFTNYRGIPMWISPEKATLGVALMNETLVLIGDRKTMAEAIDRSMEAGRNYSPLLERAARFSQEDLWVVATQLPDPLASLFVPLDTQARGFDGGISMRDGLRLDATLDAGSEDGAAFAADSIGQSIPTLPPILRGLEVTPEADHVLLKLDVSREQFAASLRQGTASPPRPLAPSAPPTPPPAPPTPVAAAPPPPPEPAKPAGPQIIHIYGLDGGPREIVLPPVKQK